VSAENTARSTLAAVHGDGVRALQHVLYRAAKADPERRFHALRDKVYREGVLWRAWYAVRRNNGAPGTGKTTLADVGEYGKVRREGTGTPQGGPASPLLCNIYLHRLDRAWDAGQHGVLVRYCDDLVVMCATRQQAEAALERLRQLLAGLGLEPKAAKTRIVHPPVAEAEVMPRSA
jgi:Reverse transcriptase (RNA-dependent DNA polymerase)